MAWFFLIGFTLILFKRFRDKGKSAESEILVLPAHGYTTVWRVREVALSRIGASLSSNSSARPCQDVVQRFGAEVAALGVATEQLTNLNEDAEAKEKIYKLIDEQPRNAYEIVQAIWVTSPSPRLSSPSPR